MKIFYLLQGDYFSLSSFREGKSKKDVRCPRLGRVHTVTGGQRRKSVDAQGFSLLLFLICGSQEVKKSSFECPLIKLE